MFKPLLLPFDALIWVLSVFRDYRAGMAKRMERKHAKVEGIQEVGETAKLSSLTSSHSNDYITLATEVQTMRFQLRWKANVWGFDLIYNMP